MAAAFAALVSLQNNIHLIFNHPCHSFSFEEKQIQSLWERVLFLIYFMKSYDNSHGARKEGAEALEMRIARAAQAAEDVIESHVVDQIRGGKTRRSRFLLDLQKAIQDMDYMMRKAIKVYLRGTEAEQPTYLAAATSSTPLTSTMVGFDDVLLQLLDKLTGVPLRRLVIPIVGMGGIGKTTLSKNAFEHPLILEHFDVRLWATISQQYSVQKIIAELLRQFNTKTVDKFTSGSVDDVEQGLYKSLCRSRRYLIVLDDMWSLEAWDEINFFFPDTNNGSRIVVTTRNLGVANHISNLRFEMHCLNKESSWHLFCQKAFAAQRCPPELEEIGKKIVKKCNGLALAIVVIGGHLRKSPMSLEYWENVAHHMNSILNSTENEHCLDVLSLSYSYLPAHLKPCFLYLGAFPEDEKIYEWDVAKFWIAEGFIQAYQNTRLEVVAEHYLLELSERNLISIVERRYNRKIVCFRVHDLLREMCLKIAKEEKFLDLFDSPRPITRERRVVVSGKVPEMNHQAPIRSLIFEGGWLSCGLKLLRTLNKVVASSTSESIFEHLNLRYLTVDLDFKYPRTVYLPSSMSLLWNLQILRIRVPDQCSVVAPYEIWELLQLRHLEIDPICLVDPLPVDGSDQANNLVLRNLDTLWRVENLRLSEEVCRRIPNVRELQLSYRDEASWCYCLHNLGHLHHLEFLVCKFEIGCGFKWHDFSLSLSFPTSLKELHLSGCGVDWEELTTMVGSLPHLVCLRLYPNSVIGSVWNSPEGKFLSLENLEIYGCDDLINWNADSSQFPVLQNLYFRNLSKLDEFPSSVGDIPTIRHIVLSHCSVSSSVSALRMLVEQEDQGNERIELEVSFLGDTERLLSFREKMEEEDLSSNNLVLLI